MRTTTRAAVNAGKRGQRDAEKIKRRNRSVGKCEACRSDCFIAAWARPNSFVAIHDATAAAKSPKKFHIFHERHVWKSSSVNKRSSPAENSMIAASHPAARALRNAQSRPSIGIQPARPAGGSGRNRHRLLDCALCAQSHSKIPAALRRPHAKTRKFRRGLHRLQCSFVSHGCAAPLRIT